MLSESCRIPVVILSHHVGETHALHVIESEDRVVAMLLFVVVSPFCATSREVDACSAAEVRVVFSEALRPTAAHICPTIAERSNVHLGIDEACDRSTRAPWATEMVGHVLCLLLDVAVIEYISVFLSL